jgi:hypothetical protein
LKSPFAAPKSAVGGIFVSHSVKRVHGNQTTGDPRAQSNVDGRTTGRHTKGDCRREHVRRESGIEAAEPALGKTNAYA